MKAIDVAYGLINLTEPEKGDLISNLKTQKLLYYAQGFHLALFNVPFFEEELLAWQYGPVVPEVYHEFKAFGANAIPIKENFSFDIFNEDQRNLLAEISSVYGQFSAVKLMDMTHEETPWKNAPLQSVISKDSLKSFFINFINGK